MDSPTQWQERSPPGDTVALSPSDGGTCLPDPTAPPLGTVPRYSRCANMYHSTMATDRLATKHRHLSFEYYTVIRWNKDTQQQKIIS